MPTKPDTETGWSKEFPKEDSYYWLRFGPDDAWPMPVRYESGQLHEIGVVGDMRWLRDVNSNAEFLPASPSDFEQLLQLRKSASNALSFLEPILAGIQSEPQPRDGILSIVESFSDGSYWNHATLSVEDLRDAVATLREALAPVNDLRDRNKSDGKDNYGE